MQGPGRWETQVVSLVLLGTPGADWQTAPRGLSVFPSVQQEWLCRASCFPEGDCSPGTVTCSHILPAGPRDKVQYRVVLPKLLSKAASQGVRGCAMSWWQ